MTSTYDRNHRHNLGADNENNWVWCDTLAHCPSVCDCERGKCSSVAVFNILPGNVFLGICSECGSSFQCEERAESYYRANGIECCGITIIPGYAN